MTDFPQKRETIATAQSLTTSYVATNTKAVVDTSGYAEASFYMNFTPLSAAAHITTKLEFSPDGSTYYQETAEEVTAGAAEIYLKTRDANGVASGTSHKFTFSVPITDRFMKATVKNSANSGTLSATVLLSVLNS